MDSLAIQDIYIYPIKSLGGISLQESEVHKTGLQYDRRWMLTDEGYNFISQRTCPQMALLQVNLSADFLIITHKKTLFPSLAIPLHPAEGKEVAVSIWDDVCTAFEISTSANKWFSDILNISVKLVYMPETTRRLVDADYAKKEEIVSFADAFPLLMIGQSSLDDLNLRLARPLPMTRFRPNIVFNGGAPYVEDLMYKFQIGDITFMAVKPCARCVITTIDTEFATKGTEPLKTLSTYRSSKNKIMFGQNLLYFGNGSIKVGDKLTVQEFKKTEV